MKPEEVESFERLAPKAKDAVRVSDQWPAIAAYYNRLFAVIQHNVAVYAGMMSAGRAHGIVPYWGGNFVNPLHSPIGGDRTPDWHKDPNRSYWHKPACGYVASGWKDPALCGCRDRIGRRT